MPIQFLACGGDPDITYRITLEGVDYDFRFRYLQRLTNVSNGLNVKADEWKLYLGLSGREPLLETSLKTNRDLLAPFKYREGCPQGVLLLRDTTADESLAKGGIYAPERVDFDNLGIDKRFRLLYITSDEV